MPFFSMTRFNSWDLAHKFYSDKYFANEIQLVPTADGRVAHPPAPALPKSRPATTSIAVAPVQPVVAVSTGVHPPAGTASAPALLPTASSILTRVLIEPPMVENRDAYIGILNSPFGRVQHPIVVTSAFPTPEPPTATKASKPSSGGGFAKGRKPILQAKRSPFASRPESTLAKAIRLARKNPTPGPSKVKQAVLGKKSAAATRIVRRGDSGGKGKAKGKPTLVHGDSEDSEIDILVFSDDSNADGIADPPHPMVLRPRIEPLDYNRQYAFVNASTQTVSAPPTPAVIITTSTAATPAIDNSARYNPFQHSPFTHLLNPAPVTPPRVSNATISNSPASFEQLVADASKTPRSAASQRRFDIITEAIEKMNAETPKAARHPTPALSSPLPQYSTPASADLVNATNSTQSCITGSAPHNNATLFSTHSSPETEYGLSSDLDAEFLDKAAHLLDQVYMKPAV